MRPSQPIGIFDSGMGGLTVAHAVHRLLPNEHLIYFGDTKHLPYGDKSSEAIQQYSFNIVTYLLSSGCKAIVIACNSASTAAGDFLHQRFGHLIPIINVVDPLVQKVHEMGFRKVGLIATKATTQSGVYQRALEEQVAVHAKATPLLVPMIEEGFTRNHISKAIIEEYLLQPEFKDIDALLLACTHYPLIRSIVEEYLPGVHVLDSTEVTAKALHKTLQETGLLCQKREQENEFLISDYTETFDQQAQIFFGQDIDLRTLSL